MDMAKVYFLSQLLYLFITVSYGGIHPDGVSEVARAQDDQGNYHFGYKVSDQEGEHYRREGTDANGAVVGSYGFVEADGRRRIVDYIADEHGFRAHVRTNEPGTAESSPAGVTIVKEGYQDPSSHLDFAATSISSSTSRNPSKQHPDRVFGVRLTPISSQQHSSDLDTPYVRNNPPGYPPEGISTATDRKRPYTPSHSRDSSAYYPPLNPFPSGTDFRDYQPSRTPVQSLPSQPSASIPDSSSPFVPPYGGGYDTLYIDGYGNRNDVNRRPDVSMTAIHGGHMRDPFISSSPRQHHGVTRVRSSSPRRPDYPPVQDDRILIATRNDITIPSSNTNNPNLVLRAVAIPNGIQAVHVDPSTGEVHRSVVYPAFDRQGRGFSDYNRNARTFNNFPDTDYLSYDQEGYTGYDPSDHHNTDLRHVPGTRRRFSNTPNNVERPAYAGEGILSNRQPLTTPEDLSLLTPSARDLAGLPPYLRHGYDVDPGSYRHAVNFRPNLNIAGRSPTLDNRYPSYQVITDFYHPGYANSPDYDNRQGSFNPYFGALPSSPGVSAYPNYQRAGVFAQDYSKGEQSANNSKKKSSVEFVHDESKTDGSFSDKSH